MKNLFMLAALGCTVAGFADHYNQGYQNNQPQYQYQGQYYQQNQPYYQSQGTTYYQSQPQGTTYYQNQPQTQYQNQPQYSQQSSGMSSGYISHNEMTPNMTSTNMNQTQTKAQDAASTDQDKQINSRIRDKLDDLGIKGYETIILRTQNGIVMISGSVDKIDDINKIRDKIKEVEGVKTVNNQLTAKNR